MISIMETIMGSFFGNWTGFGEKTPKSAYAITDNEAKPQLEMNRNNLIIRKEGINVQKEDGSFD